MRLQHLLLFPLACVPCTGFAQTILTVTPSADCTIGYHDNYNTENNNYDWSPHYDAVAQPGTQGGVNKSRLLMTFDLSSIPPDATVLAAFLSLTAFGPFGGGDVGEVGHVGQNECTLRRIIEPWNVGVVTWNTRPDASPTDEVVLASSDYATQNYLHIDVTMLVQDMVADPGNSHGFEFALVNETVTRGMAFHSSEGPDQDRWPLLTIVYGECGAIGMGVAPITDAPVLSLIPSIARTGEPVRINADRDLPQGLSIGLVNASGQEIASFGMTGRSLLFTVPSIASGAYTVTMRTTRSILGTIGTLVVR